MENIIGVPITKRMQVFKSIQACPISWKNFDYKEYGGKRAFLANPKHQCHVSQYGEQYCHASNKRNGDY